MDFHIIGVNKILSLSGMFFTSPSGETFLWNEGSSYEHGKFMLKQQVSSYNIK